MTKASLFAAAALAAFMALPGARAQEALTVAPVQIADEKAVFATVESRSVVPARARIGGTLVTLRAGEGDRVEAGQVIGMIVDDKLALQIRALDAQIAGLEAQRAQAATDLGRVEALVNRGTLPTARLDEIRTALRVAENALQARRAERSVLVQRTSEGEIEAPASGRVLDVPVTLGSVVMPGETIATLAEENLVLRLRLPERHARFLSVGDPVRLDGAAMLRDGRGRGTIGLVYPQIENGRVVADAEVKGLGDYFVGERVRVWVSAGTREAFVIPADYLLTRYGVDYVHLARADAPPMEVPVQRGRQTPDGVEILSGLAAGDRLVRP
ncbi:efflux RND transporter periplasmic adaptor subunit [Futiania mangrovi]|uniref:Efflux RND transporter periplasmic adaptor subunit n=1 Tax=Futiania mangrovi TaxID=2959716 RepID=A0A9J6PKY6_9PROT|nr:efflux RND transporter periplasmic adaptor subunit [Futiania mangrovii]MCP1336722.1 efflux RND transporter periplasmic adaptor subunit [Futiania mangrovii]